MTAEILDLLNHFPRFQDCRIWEIDEASSGAFLLKVRCVCKARLSFQIWIKQGNRELRYADQLFSGKQTVLRWDNAPHFPNLENFPHHFHDTRGKRSSSRLMGDPLNDLSYVLREVEEFLETKT